jgi:hypothetical protein
MSLFRFAHHGCALAAIGLIGTGGAAMAGASRPVVVELFTSQGCSSCPPANANLAALSDRPGVLALSFGVTYWDYLGWKDTFARPEFTARQETYERPLGHEGAFTPQIVVNGQADVVGNELPPLESLIGRQARSDGPALQVSAGTVTIGAGTAPGRGADVWLVRYDPRLVDVPVRRGENGGRTLPHKNVVHQLARIGQWTGAAASFALPPAGELRTAVLVQAPGGGRILAAATD